MEIARARKELLANADKLKVKKRYRLHIKQTVILIIIVLSY